MYSSRRTASAPNRCERNRPAVAFEQPPRRTETRSEQPTEAAQRSSVRKHPHPLVRGAPAHPGWGRLVSSSSEEREGDNGMVLVSSDFAIPCSNSQSRGTNQKSFGNVLICSAIEIISRETKRCVQSGITHAHTPIAKSATRLKRKSATSQAVPDR